MRLPGGYELVERLATGGMGQIWRAWDPRLERDVAIKIGSGLDEQTQERLQREGRALARLRHPAIVTVYDIGRDRSGVPFLVMELLEGEDLGHRLEREGSLGARRAVELMLPILDRLAIAHDSGVIHRDLKPENIFLALRPGGREEPTLVDFGIAKTHQPHKHLTAGLLGTPAFMAPEQLRRGVALRPAADQWGAAVTLYYLASGVLPFGGDNVADLFVRIAEAPLPFPRDGSIPPGLFRLLARATRKEPDERYAHVRELADALREWRATVRRTTEPPPRPTSGTAPTLDEAPLPQLLDQAIRNSLGKT